MTNRELFGAMTDDQLAEWDMIHRTVKEATDNLKEARATVERLVGERIELQSRHRAELANVSTHLAEVSRKHTDQMQAARRASASLVVALGAIKNLLDALTASNMQEAQRFFPGEVFRAMQDAQEVIKAYGIPF